MAYIYQITNDINGKIYIGKTEISIEKRFKDHCKDAFKERNEKRPLYSAMRKYGIEHFHIELVEETDNPNEREIYWIEQKQSFKNGYNATLGGDGRRLIDYDVVIAVYAQLQNITETSKTLNIDASTVKYILESKNIQIKSSDEILKEKFSIPVHMLDLEGNYIKTFASSHEAARYMVDNKLTGCKHSTIRQHISEVCKGRRQTAAKFKWKY